MADYLYTRLVLPDGQYAINYPGRNTEPTETHPGGRQSQLALEAASFLPGYAISLKAAGGDCTISTTPDLTAPDKTTLDLVVANHQADANPNGLIDDATGYLLVWGYTDFTPGAGQTKMTDIPRPAYGLGEYGATLLSRWTGTAWEYVAQPTFTAFEFHVAARINDIDGVITQDASWQVLGGVVSHPQFFIPDLTKVIGALDMEIKTTGATAELRVEEQSDGGTAIVATTTLPDTGGAWQRFSFNNTVPPSAGKNTYELQGRRNGATAAEVRYVTLSLLENKL